MIELDEWIKGKKVLILGFGREGESTYRVLKASGTYQELAVDDLTDRGGYFMDIRAGVSADNGSVRCGI